MTSSLSFFFWRERVPKKDVAIILHTVLKRTPIIFTGTRVTLIDAYVKAAANLIPHRHKVHYGIDILKKEEVENLILAEKHNYDSPRIIILSLSNYTPIAIRNFSEFNNWIIGVNNRDKKKVLQTIRENNGNITIFDTVEKRIKFTTENKNYRFENTILDEIIKQTDVATSRLIRIIEKKVKIPDTPFAREILNFDEEREKIEQELLDNKILNFVHAARRLLAILLRLKMIKEFTAENIVVSEESLINAIGYEKGQIKELLNLIKWEWNESFFDLITMDKDQEIGDWIDSLWV